MHDIMLLVNGKEYIGRYRIKGNVLWVEFQGIEKVTQLGGHQRKPELLARLLLRELIRQERD